MASSMAIVAFHLGQVKPNRSGSIGTEIPSSALKKPFGSHVILNGDSPTPTRIVDGVVQVIALANAEQRLAKKNELKARGTLLMALSISIN
nr:hypothetical protein [Tanacetum cinerariifolium]